MLKPIRNIDKIDTIIRQYLLRNHLLNDNDCVWEIRKSPLGGFGVFAKRSIQVGEIVFKDRAIILGPRASQTTPPVCVNCYQSDNLQTCKNCGIFVCSELCQNSDLHQKECRLIQLWQNNNNDNSSKSLKLLKILTPIRSLLLNNIDREVVLCLKAHRSDQHGFEVDVMKNELNFNLSQSDEEFMRLVCSILDSNAFEVVIGNEQIQTTSVRGLYPLASLVNHNCTPNTTHIFDNKQHMIVRASIFIEKDTEIFHSYSRLIWGTMTRRYHLLKTKHFLCRCKRCVDPTEFHTYMSSVLCKSCINGYVLPLEPFEINCKWQCETCKQSYKRTEIGSITSLLGSILGSFDKNDHIYIIRFIEQKLPKLISENHEIMIEAKYKLIWILGYTTGLSLIELTDDLLSMKEKYCRDLLNLVDLLNLGQCKLKSLLLYELYSVLKEKIRRNSNLDQLVGPELETLLKECADIMMYDVTAPQEIKRHPVWRSLCI